MPPLSFVSHRPAIKILAVVWFVAAFCSAHALPARRSWPTTQHQEGHSVISESTLRPPLRSPEVTLRFSPDGNYLSLQDPAGVTLLLRNPLQMLFYIPAENVYPVAFSSDSQSVILVSRGLSYAKWKLPDGEKIASGSLASQDDCADGSLSPGGEFFACLKPDLDFVLFAISGGKILFEPSKTPSSVMNLGPLHALQAPIRFYLAPLGFDSAFSSLFGVVRTNEPTANPNHLLNDSSMRFSPDAKMLIARLPNGSLGVDLVARKSFEPPAAIQKALPEAVALETSDRVITVDNLKGSSAERATVHTLINGDLLANLSLSATRLQMACNPRFVIEYNSSPEGQTSAAFDLRENRPLETPPALALDIHDAELAVYTQNNSVALYRIGERNLLANLPLPLTPLPPLRTASVTPNLNKLAFSLDGIGAIFDVATGQRIATLPKFSTVNFLDQRNASLLFPKFHEEPARISHVDLSQGDVSPSWEIPKESQLRSGGLVLLDYSILKGTNISPYDLDVGMAFPYRLRAVDPGTGKELWKREFKHDPPTPFADPQGERLVLGWKAKSSQARSAASRNPVAREMIKNTKLTDHDSYFEVLDARSGNSIGGVLVAAGTGAAFFDSAFSAGDALILQKDAVRVSLYSLLDGQLKTHLVGVQPSVSAESKLLALDVGEKRLGLFDLTTGVKLAEKVFSERLAYSHFSADGKRLFVLTENQVAVILDVSSLRSASVPSQQPANDKN